MRSQLPKVMHRLVGIPLIAHVLKATQPLAPERTVVVVAPHMESVREGVNHVMPVATFAVQTQQKGTADAVRSGLDALAGYTGTVVVLYGDTPMIRTETLAHLLSEHEAQQATISLLGMRPPSPMGYGRLVMSAPPLVERIVECKDATPEEKLLPYVWAGVMAFDAAFVRENLPKLTPSPVTGEFYLTELIAMATNAKRKTIMVEIDPDEAMGINDRVQLAIAEKVVQMRLREKAMREGVTLIDPGSVYFSMDTVLGRDVVVHPQVMFGAGVTVADNVEIRSFSHIEGATIGTGATIGPFARVRPGSVVGEGAHVGNFVELKKTTLGKNAKANHLSYVGDATVGEGANIGAGTITCNYDGTHKYNTIIGDNAFIGSNSSLVAPVKIGAGAVVGAGSVITDDVPAQELGLGRARQVNKKRQKKSD